MTPSFTFQSRSGFAGSPMSFQLCLRSQARQATPAVVFQSARLSFNEQIPEISVAHVEGNPQRIQKFGPNVTNGNADLSLRPGEIKVLEFSYTPVAQAQIEVRFHPRSKLILGLKLVSFSRDWESKFCVSICVSSIGFVRGWNLV